MKRPERLSELGELIAEYRVQNELTQQMLADALGTTRTAVAHLEQGYRWMGADVVSGACELLAIPEPQWKGWSVEALPRPVCRVVAHFVTFYTPVAVGRDATRAQEQAIAVRNKLVYAVKDAKRFPGKGVSHDPYALAASRLRKHFPELFVGRTFVPVPTSKVTAGQTRWPGRKLADAMAKLGQLCMTAPLIERVEEVEASSSLSADERLSVAEHMETLRLAGTMKPGIVLVDDVVTRGTTMLACARLLREAGWPGVLLGAAVAYSVTPSSKRSDHSVRRYDWRGDRRVPVQAIVIAGDPEQSYVV